MDWRVKLVEGWQRAWTWLSIQVAALGVAFGALTTDVQAAVLDFIGLPASRVPLALGLMMMIGRLINQAPKAPPRDDQ